MMDQSALLKCLLEGKPFLRYQDLRSGLTPFARGDLLIREGEVATVFHLIYQGRVQLIKQHPDGQPRRTTTLSRGSSLGLPAVLADSAYSATALALTPGQTYSISQTALQQFLARYPRYYRPLAQQLARTLLHYEKLAI